MLFSNHTQNEQFPKEHGAGRTLAALADVIVYQYSLHSDCGFSESHLCRDCHSLQRMHCIDLAFALNQVSQ